VSRTPLREALGRLPPTARVEQLRRALTVVSDRRRRHPRPVRGAPRPRGEHRASPPPRRPRRVRRAGGELRRRGSLGDDEARRYYALIARFDDALDAAVGNDYLTAALRTVRTHLVPRAPAGARQPARLAASGPSTD
jgi:DNA-binding GntR family transcriptional regulator